MEIEKLRKKLEDTEREMAKLIAEMNTDQYEAKVSIQTVALAGIGGPPLPAQNNWKMNLHWISIHPHSHFLLYF